MTITSQMRQLPDKFTRLRVLLLSLASLLPLTPGISSACTPEIISLAAMYDQSTDIFTASVGAVTSLRKSALEPGSEYISDYIARLRAFRDGISADLGELWGFGSDPGYCGLGTWLNYTYSYDWEDESPDHYLAELSFSYDARAHHSRIRTELPRAKLRIKAINPFRNSPQADLARMNIRTADFNGYAVWTPKHIREYLDDDGEVDTTPPQDGYLLEGPAVINLIAELAQSPAPLRLHMNLGGQRPDVEINVPVSQLGDAATKMLACVRDNQQASPRRHGH